MAKRKPSPKPVQRNRTGLPQNPFLPQIVNRGSIPPPDLRHFQNAPNQTAGRHFARANEQAHEAATAERHFAKAESQFKADQKRRGKGGGNSGGSGGRSGGGSSRGGRGGGGGGRGGGGGGGSFGGGGGGGGWNGNWGGGGFIPQDFTNGSFDPGNMGLPNPPAYDASYGYPNGYTPDPNGYMLGHFDAEGNFIPPGGTQPDEGPENEHGNPPNEGLLDKYLSGEQRDAYEALKALMNSYNLGSLAPQIYNFISKGYSQDTISIMLQTTDEYQERFAGNEQRRANHLGTLTPAEYLATERSYQQILRQEGMPKGFYDDLSDFTDWIGKDVSPNEIQSRVDMAKVALHQAPAHLMDALGKMGIDRQNLVAYFLDTDRALPLLQTQYNAAQIGASAMRNNLVMNPTRSAAFATLGITTEQANQAYAQIAKTLPTLESIGRIWNMPYNQIKAEDTFLAQKGEMQRYTERLTGQERGAFQGTPGASTTPERGSMTRPTPTSGAGQF